MSFEISLYTRYSETAQDGIIHHSSYAPYFEEARSAFFKTLGCDINALEKQKIFCTVVSLTIDYLKPLLSDEKITVQVSFESASKVRFQLKYQIYRKDVLTTRATSMHCFLNETFKPIPIPKELCL